MNFVTFNRTRGRSTKKNRLWVKGAVPVLRAASKKSVMHHALGKEQKQNYQDNYKQKLSNLDSERRWFGRFLLVHDGNLRLPAKVTRTTSAAPLLEDRALES
jgi:hypothetical protein